MEREKLNEISEKVVCAAINVHRELGPGLLESIYEVCLWKELASSNLDVQRQVGLPVMYKGEPLLMSFRMDLLVEKEIIVELKAVEAILPVHEAQLLTYLRLADKRLGLLMNFNVPVMKDGIKRRVNRFRPLLTAEISASLRLCGLIYCISSSSGVKKRYSRN